MRYREARKKHLKLCVDSSNDEFGFVFAAHLYKYGRNKFKIIVTNASLNEERINGSIVEVLNRVANVYAGNLPKYGLMPRKDKKL